MAVEIDTKRVLKKLGLDEGGRVQQYIDSECLRLCDPKVPKDHGDLIKSGEINTKIGSGEVIYNTPYARRWYYMPADFRDAPERGNFWFERMKQEHRKDILEGARRRVNEGGDGD